MREISPATAEEWRLLGAGVALLGLLLALNLIRYRARHTTSGDRTAA